jgi:hypothetical protein
VEDEPSEEQGEADLNSKYSPKNRQTYGDEEHSIQQKNQDPRQKAEA